jgi:hypothetical protein
LIAAFLFGGKLTDLTHREAMIKMLRQAAMNFEEDPWGEAGSENDLAVYSPNGKDAVYMFFSSDGFLTEIGVFYR